MALPLMLPGRPLDCLLSYEVSPIGVYVVGLIGSLGVAQSYQNRNAGENEGAALERRDEANVRRG